MRNDLILISKRELFTLLGDHILDSGDHYHARGVNGAIESLPSAIVTTVTIDGRVYGVFSRKDTAESVADLIPDCEFKNSIVVSIHSVDIVER